MGTIDPEDTPAAIVDNLAVMLAVVGTDALVPQLTRLELAVEDLAEMVESLWRAERPETVQVLEAVSRSGTGKVRKAAKKTLFKRRSA